MAKKLKLDIKKTILIGFGFMSTSIAWAIYDPYITKILNAVLTSNPTINAWSASLIERFPALLEFSKAQGNEAFTLVPLFIGIIMTFDNIFGVIFQPTFGKLSDRCRSKFGKRRPFIFLGAPVSALIFALIPLVFLKMGSLPILMTTVILFVFTMSLWRAPVVALMPDLTPSELRSEGNAIINLCGGAGSLVGMIAGTIVTAVFSMIYGKGNFEEVQTYPYVFLIGSVVMVIAVFVLRFFVHEPDSRLKAVADHREAEAIAKAQKEEKARRKANKLSKGERISLVFMLAGLFFLFCGSNAITTFFALFAEEVLHKTTAQATFLMAVFAVCSMAAAIPAGKLGKKIGRKKTILIGLALFATLSIVYFFRNSPALNWMIWILLVIGGVANMLITVNTLPLVLEIGGQEKIGTFTGYYYTATFSAQIAAPIVFGIFRMFSGTYSTLFVFSPIAFIISLLCILFVKHGEAIPDDLIKEAEMADD
ncbi:MAG: MFS transporter [Clostridia bacterium]|nr:MFS transporter [Clostridia bacterium]